MMMEKTMHNITRVQIKQGIGLTCVTAERTKTSCLSAMLALPLGAPGRSLAALLPYVLRSSCQDYRGQQAVAACLDELYGARLEPIVRKCGEVQLIGFVADVMDERYAMQPEERLFSSTAQLMASLLLHPAPFTAETVNREAEQLCAKIAARTDEKRTWAIQRMYQYMCAEEAYSLCELGDIDVIRTITPEQLEAQYRSVMQTAPLELFYYGSLTSDTVAQQLAEAMRERPVLEKVELPQFDVPRKPLHPGLQQITEEEPVTQGKLTIGLRSGITVLDVDYPALVVFNACFGGTASSRLFRTVREQMSLCYYASSMTDKNKGLLVVAAGIENESEPKARAEILRQLEDIQAGGLTAEEVEAAKRSVLASLRTTQDSPLMLEYFYQAQAASGVTETLDQLMERIEQVSVADVTAAARKAVPDTVYFLKGAGA
ncbi:MAG: pitrilysin family protein [Eubacteriales bacterium]|nr:pitrilysin family protein [Eubacteriales bacterium]